MLVEIKEDLKEVKRIFKMNAQDEKSPPFILSALTLFSGKFGEYNPKKLIPAAVSVELLGLGVEKHYEGRRTKDEGRNKEAETELIMGDYYYAKAIRLAAPLGEEVVKIGAEAVTQVAEGELTANVFQKAALHQAACEVGSLLGKVNSPLKEELKKFGRRLGIIHLSTGD